MGRKSSAKNTQPPSTPESPAKGPNLFVIGAILVLVAAGGLLFWTNRTTNTASDVAAPSAASSNPSSAENSEKKPDVLPAVQISDENQKIADATAALGPHKQANLPPIPFRGYAPPRPPEVVAAAFYFAAEHPEILSYVPCFCGCERSGHKGNHDCFVRSRAANGDVIEWEEHGIECAVCIDVATKSRQMYSAGASAKDIRTAIEKQYAGAKLMTPTAHPPAHAGHGN